MASNADDAPKPPSEDKVLEMLRTPHIGAEFDSIVVEVLYDELNDIKTDIYNQLMPGDAICVRDVRPKDLMDYSDLFAAIRDKFPGCEITKWNYTDKIGSIYGFPEDVSTDVVYSGDEVYFCDVHHEIDTMNLIILLRIAHQFDILNGKSPGCMIFTRKACERVLHIAELLDVKVILV